MTLKDPHLQREAQKYEKPVASRELLLSIIEQSAIPLTYNALAKKLNYQDENSLIGLKRRLRAMENSGQLIFNKFKQYAIPANNSVITGKVLGHRDGFGFFAVESSTESTELTAAAKKAKRGKDFYISSHEMKRVFHGDIVEAILVDRADRKGRKEVRILEVVQPRKAPIVGRYYVKHHVACVIPDDAKIKQEILKNHGYEILEQYEI